MRVPVSWLRELVAIDDLLVADLARRLTMAGLEVETIETVGQDWREVTIARVTDLEPHPRRERLTIAQLDLGGRTATVVTGATNLKLGDLVPHVAPGGRLPGGQIGAQTFAGITSEGMVCSGDELKISPDREGIYVLEAGAPVGVPLADYLQETVLDIYITANRPDCMSMLGIAREVHALFGAAYQAMFLKLREPATAEVAGTPGEPPVSELLRVRIEDPSGCPRFSAAVVRGITIGPSPQWLQRRLHFAGVRPISNVVDVTNYVMLEVGQPLHAFDASRLGSQAIVVRRAHEGEPLRTLDGEDRLLASSMLVVADEQRARSLAGIMGGEDSEIADQTRDVILEGANWDRATIRLTSAAVGLSSEASRRFGRGVDPDLTTLGVARAVELSLQLAGGRAAAGLVDEYSGRQPLPTIRVTTAQIEALLGTHYSDQQVFSTLDALGFAPVASDGVLETTVPGWRRFDVEGRADLAEEVARVVGFDIVPATMLRGALPAPRADGDHGYSDELHARRALAAAGLSEVITYSLVDPQLASRLVAEPAAASTTDAETAAAAELTVANPQSTEQSVLRDQLLGSLLGCLSTNLRQQPRVALFELARTWHGQLDPLPDERRHIGIVMAGPRSQRHWSEISQPLDFYDLKGLVEALLGAFRVDASYQAARHPSFHPGRTAELVAAGHVLGVLGQVHPVVADRFDLPAQTLAAELDFERILALRQPLTRVATPSRFPAADRDLAIVVDEAVTGAALVATIRESAAPLLEYVQLFDVYRGEPIAAGRKSLAFALRYRAPDRTLADDEVNATHGRVEAALRERFGGEVRGREAPRPNA